MFWFFIPALIVGVGAAIASSDSGSTRHSNEDEERNNEKKRKKEELSTDIEQFKKKSVALMKTKYNMDVKFEEENSAEMIVLDGKDKVNLKQIDKLAIQIDDLYKLIGELEAEKNEILAI